MDLDQDCRYAFEANNGNAKFIHKDIRTLTAKEVKPYFSEQSKSAGRVCPLSAFFNTYTKIVLRMINGICYLNS